MQFNKENKNMYILLGAAILIILAGIITLIIWGSSGRGGGTPTVSVDAIYTAAYQTVAAAQTAQQASLPPTDTPAPSPSPTLPAAATPLPINTLVFASPTTGVAQGCDNAVFVNDVTIPDGTVMSPGQTFTKTWLMQNTGTCTWDTTYSMAFVSGDAMSGAKTPLTLSVPPGQQVKVSVNMVAPATLGDAKGYWRLMNANGVFFGDSPWVLIKVEAATPTATATTAPPTATNMPVTPAADATP